MLSDSESNAIQRQANEQMNLKRELREKDKLLDERWKLIRQLREENKELYEALRIVREQFGYAWPDEYRAMANRALVLHGWEGA